MIVVNNLNNIHLGDILCRDINDSLEYVQPMMVIKIEVKDIEDKVFLIYDIEKQETRIELFTNDEVLYFIGNIRNMTSFFNKEHIPYIWLGIERGNDKILVDLSNLVVEYFNENLNKWIILDESNISQMDEEENSLSLSIDSENIYIINLINLNVEYYDKNTECFESVTNISLGRDGEYVFDRNNKLKENK